MAKLSTWSENGKIRGIIETTYTYAHQYEKTERYFDINGYIISETTYFTDGKQFTYKPYLDENIYDKYTLWDLANWCTYNHFLREIQEMGLPLDEDSKEFEDEQ